MTNEKPNMKLQKIGNATLRMKWYDALPKSYQVKVQNHGESVALPPQLEFAAWIKKTNSDFDVVKD